MKKLLMLATAAFLFTGVAFAQDGAKKEEKKCAKGKECCKKDKKDKECCSKDAKHKHAPEAKKTEAKKA